MTCLGQTLDVMNTLNPIEKLYNLYSDKEETLRITEIINEELDIGNGPADLLSCRPVKFWLNK